MLKLFFVCPPCAIVAFPFWLVLLVVGLIIQCDACGVTIAILFVGTLFFLPIYIFLTQANVGIGALFIPAFMLVCGIYGWLKDR